MTELRFNIELPANATQADAKLLQEFLEAELPQKEELGQPSVVVVGGGRSIGEVAAVVAAAIPIVIEGAKAIDAIFDVVERGKKLLGVKDNEKNAGAIDLDELYTMVEGEPVKLKDLTDEQWKALKES